MKRWQLIVAILLAVALVAALVVFLVWSSQRPKPKTPTKPLSDIKMNEVSRFTVRGADGRETRLERDAANDWYLVAPVDQEADQKIVNWLVEDLLDIESSNAAPVAEIDLAYTGLATPTATIILGLRDGEDRTIQVGLTEPRYLAYFVRIGDSVYLFPWDVVGRALVWLDALPLPPQPTPTGP